MEKYQKILVGLMTFIVTFVTTIIVSEFAAYLLTLPNTIANIFGYFILIIIFALILVFGYIVIKSLNK